jgi:hypothetical protein
MKSVKKISKGQYDSIISETDTEILINDNIRINKSTGLVTFFDNVSVWQGKVLRARASIAPIFSPINVTVSRAIQPTDVGWALQVDVTSDIDLTFNTDSLEYINDIFYIDQVNTAKANFVAGTGVTLQYKSGHSLSTNGRYTRTTVQKINSTTYRIIST